MTIGTIHGTDTTSKLESEYLPPSQTLVYYAALFHHAISGFKTRVYLHRFSNLLVSYVILAYDTPLLCILIDSHATKLPHCKHYRDPVDVHSPVIL